MSLFIRVDDQYGPAVRASCRNNPKCAAMIRSTPPLVQLDFGNECAARLEPRQVDLVHVTHRPLLEQHDIAVPAMRLGAMPATGTGIRPVSRSSRREIEHAGALAEAGVGLLQADDVGVDLVDHSADPLRIEAAVGADTFVDIIRGDQRAVRTRPTSACVARDASFCS